MFVKSSLSINVLSLVLESQAGNEHSKNSWMSDLDPMLSRAVHRLSLQHLLTDDAFGVGRVALWEAVRDFDPAQKTTFKQFAWKRITASIRGVDGDEARCAQLLVSVVAEETADETVDVQDRKAIIAAALAGCRSMGRV